MNRTFTASARGAHAAAPVQDVRSRERVPRKGFLYWIFPLMLMLAALDVLFSGRDLTQSYAMLEKEVEGGLQFIRHPVVAWTQRAVSILLVAASLERIVSHFAMSKPTPSPILTWAFILYWLTTVAAPGLLSAHPVVSHEYAYTILFGLAVTLGGAPDRDRILLASRDGLFVYMMASLVLVPFNPPLVLDSSYSQGLLPGVPRFGGLASHPVGMGMLAQTALLILTTRPFGRRWLTIGAWLLGLAVLFFAQSKTAWIAFVISQSLLILVRGSQGAVQRLGNPRDSSFGVLLCLGLIGGALVLLGAVLVADLPGVIADFFNSSEGAKLASMTGRDRIWIVAMDEWRHNPVFGYGPTIWDGNYRQAIGMPFATHGHNQFIDTLARAGTVGFIGLVVYSIVLMAMSIRYARATGGLSLAMFVTLAMQCVSEVPLILSGYSTEVFTHLLLVATLAGAAAGHVRTRVEVGPIEPSLRTAS